MRRAAAALVLLVLCLLTVPIYAQTISTLSSTTCPGSGCAVFTSNGAGTVGVQISGTFVGTLQFEQTIKGDIWTTWSVLPNGSTTAVTSTTATGFWTGSTAGASAVRIRFSAYTSGSAVVALASSIARAGGGAGGGAGAGTCPDGQVVTAVNLAGPTCSTTIDTGAITASAPFSFKQTWNNAAVTFTGFDINNTNTASATSYLFRVRDNTKDYFCVGSLCSSTSVLAVQGSQIVVTDILSNANINLVNTGYFQTMARSYWHAPTTREFAVGSNGSSGKEYTIVVGSAPTCSAGCGTGPTISATNSVGRVTLGSSPSATTITITFSETMPTAPHCDAVNETHSATTTVPSAVSTTAVTFTGTFVASDAISWHCISWQ